MSTTRGRKRLRRPSYETTFLGGQTDRSASTSGTATQSETVPESQSQERSPAASAPLPPWVTPAPYVPPLHEPVEAPQLLDITHQITNLISEADLTHSRCTLDA
ncbi:hypothetical protein Bca52824_015939 [Brassica carinata]|uniref:Uncharacterized protein n=1 Tax=Brassica carinata TaxID=52824 RepID=A0A8X7W3J8_BRACI|nr:hypothetical protein Bca52824_015939 [Brassica carinata]